MIKNENSASRTLSKMTECFLGFVLDPKENIRRLTQFCGELLAAESSMYDRIDGTKMTRLGGWNLPLDGTLVGLGQGLGQDKAGPGNIKMGSGDVFEIRYVEPNSDGSAELGLANRSVNPSEDRLRCLFGRVVTDHGTSVGALSVFFKGEHSLSDEDREVLGIVASALASEDRRLRAEEIISQQQVKMVGSARMSALGEMAAGVAHEINNPLLAIILRVNQLKEMVNAPQLDLVKVKKTTDSIDALTVRISKIVKSLRQFCGDTQDEPFQEVLLQEILEITLELCGEKFRQSQVNLQVESFDPLLKIECMPTEISRVLMDLLSNAYDAIEDKNPKWVKIQILSSEKDVEISVVDCGSGVEKEILNKIFEPFFTTKEVNKGKGLGLSVAQGIIDKHSGSLTVDVNCPNTKFVIRLPKATKKIKSVTSS